MPKPAIIMPAVFTLGLLIMVMKKPMPVSMMKNSVTGKNCSATICAVIVVPMFAPIIMPVAWNSVMMPAFTKPTTMTVVADEL